MGWINAPQPRQQLRGDLFVYSAHVALVTGFYEPSSERGDPPRAISMRDSEVEGCLLSLAPEVSLRCLLPGAGSLRSLPLSQRCRPSST